VVLIRATRRHLPEDYNHLIHEQSFVQDESVALLPINSWMNVKLLSCLANNDAG
jgi:hypothetical protein